MPSSDLVPDRFNVTADLGTSEAILFVAGHDGEKRAATLGAFLDATIASGCLRVTLDLGAVDTLETAATGAIVAARHLLASLGGSLVVRSAPADLRHALETGDLATGSPATPAGGVQGDLERFLGPEQPRHVPPAGVVITANGGHLARQRVTFVPSG